MSTQIKPTTAAKSDSNQGNRVESYVSHQLKQTIQQVRVSDLVTGILALATFSLTFLLLAAILDAWLLPFSKGGRYFTLILFLLGNALIFWWMLFPYFFKKINPRYAAKMIEESRPGFKNSILNYLSLRRDKSSTHRAVLNEVTKRAATDLSSISPDTAVDKSNLIRIGFLLVGTAALSIGYSLLSPKSPLVSVHRIFAPASKISKPAAVSIGKVAPGDTDVFFGDRLTVTAEVRGVRDDHQVEIVYSSDDHQIDNARILMKPTDISHVFEGELVTNESGILQPLNYRIEAGDGVSPDFRVNVRPNPTISIQSIKITPPKYTQLPERMVEGNGEIQAAEGSRVEIQALANLPIQLAYIVPLASKVESPFGPDDFRELRTIRMRIDDQQAVGGMTISLNANRDRPQFTHYKIKFRSTEDFSNENPNVYPIRVIADLAPEIEITEPARKEITIPENQPLPIQVWAADLDYELQSLDLAIDHDGRNLFKRNLFRTNGEKQNGQKVNRRAVVTPNEIGLKAGDQAILFATASDNRISPMSDLPDPNVSRTENYLLIVTESVEQEKATETESNEGEDDRSEDAARDEESDQDSSENRQEQKKRGDQSDESGTEKSDNADDESDPNSDQETGENQSDEEEKQADEGGNAVPQESEKGDSAAEQSSNPDPQNTGSQSSSTDQSPESDQKNEQGSKGKSASGDEADSDPNAAESGGRGNKMAESQNSEQNDGTAASNAGNEQGATEQNGNSQSNADSKNQNGSGTGQEFRDESLQDGEREPLDRNASEGEQFERLKELLDEQEKLNGKGDRNSQSDPNSDSSKPNSNNPSDTDSSSNENSETDSDSDTDSETDSTQNPSPEDSGPQSNQNEKTAAEGEQNSDSTNPRGDQSQSNSLTQNSEGNQNDSHDSKSDAAESTTPNQNRQEDSNENEGAGGDQNTQQNPQDSSQSSESSAQGKQARDDQNESNSGSENTEDRNSDQSQNGSEEASDSKSSQSSDSQGSNSDPAESANSNSENPSSESTNSGQSGDQEQEESAGSGSKGSDSDSPSAKSNRKSEAENASNSKEMNGGGGGSSELGDGTDNAIPDGEKANMDYAKQLTDLVLDKLEEQKYSPDSKLLEQMNWTEEDLAEFLNRWNEMKKKAAAGDLEAKREYEQGLRSLGLSTKSKARKSRVDREKEFRLNEDGAVDQIPREYIDGFNSFLKRRNRSKR